MKEYNTGQRKALLSLFESNKDRHFTIDQIMEELSDEASISRSAVYRNVDRMAQEGLLRKEVSEETRKSVYQFNECSSDCEHIHLRCTECGKVFHLPDEEEEDELKSVLRESGFELDEHATILVGKCSDCCGNESK